MANEIQTTSPEDELEFALAQLTGSEFAAYKTTVASKLAQLSPHFESGLFSLFLNGYTMLDILAQNPGISLGQICRARVDGLWDKRRQEYRDSLLIATQARLQQTLMESYGFLTAQLAAAHKLHGGKIRKYLQTGDEADLGSFSINGWRSYLDAVTAIKALGGNGGGPEPVAPAKVEREVEAVPQPQVDAKKVIARQVEVRRAQQNPVKK